MCDDPDDTKAGVNMDGDFRHPHDVPLKRPMLLLGKPRHVPGDPADPSWDETRDEIWGELIGRQWWLSVDDTEHLSFTDGPTPGNPEVRFHLSEG